MARGATEAAGDEPAGCDVFICGPDACRAMVREGLVAAGWVLACQAYVQQAEGAAISWASLPAVIGEQGPDAPPDLCLALICPPARVTGL